MPAARAFLRVLAALIGLALITGFSLVLVSQTAWFRDWIRGVVVSQSADYLNGQLAIGRIDGNLVTGMRLHDVVITMDGEVIVASQDVTLRYNLWQIVTTGVSIDEIRLDAPRVSLREDRDGWTLARLVKARDVGQNSEGVRPIRIDRVEIEHGTMQIEPASRDGALRIPREIRDLAFDGSFLFAAEEFETSIERLSGRTVEPDLVIREATGDLALAGDALTLDDVSLTTDASSLSIDGEVVHYDRVDRVVNLHVSSERFSVPEIARVVPALAGVAVDMTFDAALNGPLNHLAVTLDVSSTAGKLRGDVTADLATRQQRVSGTLSLANLNLAALASNADLRSDISGDATIDVRAGDPDYGFRSWNGTIVTSLRGNGGGYAVQQLTLNAELSRAVATVEASVTAYGANITSRGRLALLEGNEAVTYDLRGSARRINARALPLSNRRSQVQTNLNLAYRVTGRESWTREALAKPVFVAALEFDESTLPGVTLRPGSRASLDVSGDDITYDADATVDDVNLRAIGEAFDVAVLRDERARGAIDGRLAVKGRGVSLATLSAEASGTITSAQVLGGEMRDVGFTARLAANDASIHATGSFTGLDPAILAARPDAQGRLDGAFVLDATATGVSAGVTADNVSGSTHLTLDSGTVGEVALNSVVMDADYRERTAFVRELSVVGPDANLTGAGTVVLDAQGQSQFTFHVDSPRVETIAKIFDIPVSGIMRADGRVTGNRTELRASGTFEGDNLQYEENGALTLRSRFDVRVPDLAFERTSGSADSQATFVRVAGQEVNELAAKTTYEDKRVTFTATARQPRRQLEAAGAVVLHADHRELHLERLSVRAASQTWTIPDGAPARVEYGSGVVGVSGLRLVNGDQEVRVNGSTGAANALQVAVANVDLAALEALLLREPRLSGRLNATGTISGTTDAPIVAADFAVANGGFRDFNYESLSGKVDIKAGRATLDARLQQNGAQWITARGYLPLSFVTGDSRESQPADGHVAPLVDADRVDLTIDSSPLGLGLVQGLTTELTAVSGTLEVHMRLTGSAADPHPQGTIAIADGKMTLPSSGVTYTNVAGRVELLDDRVHIDSLTVLDDDLSALSVTGDLAVHAREVNDVQLWINAEDFRVLDNALGDLKAYAALEISGDLRTPLIRGDAGVSIGRVDLDEIMALAGTSAYPIRSKSNGSNGEAGEDASSGWYEGLRMDLRVGVPDDLIVRSSNLQTPGATIGLGALNLTLGGDLTTRKEAGGSARLIGQINTVRGTYDFQGRRFELLREGTIRFDGGEELTPLLDIRARREIQGVEALVSVRGTIDQPEIVLSSSPPLEQADIFALIVFNQPINQLGEGDQLSLAARAQSIAAGAVAGQLAQSIGQALSVDTFEIAVAPDSGATAQLTIGQQLGKDLYVKVEQGLGEVATTNLVIEYAFNRWLRLQTNVMEGGTTPQQALFRRRQGSGIDLIVLFDKK